jgi:hypothetical protein
MSSQAFALTYLLGAAAVALWLVGRYPSYAPGSVWPVAAHLVIANVGSSLAVTAVIPASASLGPVVAMMLLVFPALVYFFVASAWLLLYVQRFVAQYR